MLIARVRTRDNGTEGCMLKSFRRLAQLFKRKIKCEPD